MSLNRKALWGLSAALLLAGIGGFLLPESLSLMSGAPAYNVFHFVFAVIGAGLAWRGSEGAVRAFNLGFGLIDLYQAAASLLHLFPEAYFLWRRADDVVHVLLGGLLVAVALSRR